MNQREDSKIQDLIELLAENELNASEREDLMIRLDQSNDGWKRCALALLESRALHQSMSSLRCEPRQSRSEHAIRPTPVESTANRLRRMGITFLAAALVLSVGMAIGRNWIPAQPEITGPSNTTPNHRLAQQLRDKDPQLIREIGLAKFGVPADSLIGFVSSSDPTQTKVYPIVESKELEKQLSDVQVPRLPSDIAQKLYQRGWRVSSQKQLVSIQLKDGSRQTVPVGKLNYQFVGPEMF